MSCISARVSLSLPVPVCVSNSIIITANVSLAKLNELLSVLRLRQQQQTAQTRQGVAKAISISKLIQLNYVYRSLKNTQDQTYLIPKPHN